MKNRGGFIHIILAIIVIVLILTFLRFDLRSLVESETGQSNFSYLWELTTRLAAFLWDILLTFLTKMVQMVKSLTK